MEAGENCIMRNSIICTLHQIKMIELRFIHMAVRFRSVEGKVALREVCGKPDQ
jgi:hypothetical protein